MWDYFISHASEDKDLIVRPFAHYLKSAGFGIWYDEFSLKVGDSLLSSINGGLSKSEYGIIFLSEAFLEKRWPQQELNGLFALEGRKKRILPVWHKLSPSDVASSYPILADRIAAKTDDGLQILAEKIVAGSFPERVSELPLSSADFTEYAEAQTAREILKSQLESGMSENDIFLFLSGYPVIFRNILGYYPEIIPAHKLRHSLGCKFAICQSHGVTGPVELVLVILSPIDQSDKWIEDHLKTFTEHIGSRSSFSQRPANDYLGSPYAGEYEVLSELAEDVRKLSKSQNIHISKPDTWSVQLLYISGRRGARSRFEHEGIKEEYNLRVNVLSYDRLLDDKRSIYG
ncbi:MAG: toll/interleukin-1 receptor domain-containing protein [Roseovarius sp.]|uniref:toll/interleukin-1 receptor domain-containing protein n=1 Tax=Roseovarius sp. TaxID=1486281 RepID=UPI0032EF4EE1